MITIEKTEFASWVALISGTWGGSNMAIARAMEVPVEKVNAHVVNCVVSRGMEDLKRALLHDNQELSMFWAIYCEAWRMNDSPETFAHAYSHLRNMLRPDSSVTFDACIELREMMDSSFGRVKSCMKCNRIMIEIPSLVPQPQICAC